MDSIDKKSKIIEMIENARSIAIMPSKVVGVDAFSAGVGLYHVLKDKNKDVSLVYPGRWPEGCDGLIKKEEVTSDVDVGELIVSIDYSDTPAAKVHYNNEEDILYLRVSPVNKDYDVSSKVRASIEGQSYDLIITIGAQVLEDLGRVYRGFRDEFLKAKIINMDNTNMNRRFGTVSVVDALEDSLSLLVLNRISQWNMKVSTKSAKALLTGITYRDAK